MFQLLQHLQSGGKDQIDHTHLNAVERTCHHRKAEELVKEQRDQINDREGRETHRTRDAAVGHEAKIGSISNEAVFYLMSRGMSEEDARALIVSGFADNVSKELPLEYAVEMNNLIRLEMKGSIG